MFSHAAAGEKVGSVANGVGFWPSVLAGIGASCFAKMLNSPSSPVPRRSRSGIAIRNSMSIQGFWAKRTCCGGLVWSFLTRFLPAFSLAQRSVEVTPTGSGRKNIGVTRFIRVLDAF